MLNRIKLFRLISILFAFTLASCAAEQPTPVVVEVTVPVLQTVQVTQLMEVEVVITPTPKPATATPEPSPTFPLILTPLSDASQPATSVELQPSAASELPPEVSFWCLPQSSGVSAPSEYSPIPPENAVKAQLVNDQVDYRGTFAQCTFVYDFKSPVPAGAQFEVSDYSNSQPFLTIALTPDPTNPNKGYALVNHSMVTVPPAWEILYEFNVSSSSSTSVWKSTAHYDRGWRGTICWTGREPDPVTLHCPSWQDTHPTDPGYIPVPTDVNTED